MADEITVKNEGGYAPHPEGPYLMVCVDVINLGEKVEQFQAHPAKVVPKVAIVFQSSEINLDTKKPFEVSVEKTLSFGDKAGLRDFLAKWRGKAFAPAEVAQGIPLHKLEGVNAIVSVEHKVSGSGRTYGKINNIAPPMKGMERLIAKDYQRGEFWETRKAEYAEGVRVFKASASNGRGSPEPSGRPMAAVAQDDDLPF
jgi:hypothetical protein